MNEHEPIRPLAPPPWLRPDTHAAMQAAYDREMAAGHDPAAAVAVACAVLLTRAAGRSGWWGGPARPRRTGPGEDGPSAVAGRGGARAAFAELGARSNFSFLDG